MIEAKPAHKLQNIKFKKGDVQVLNSSAIASGYAGRDPQGGFAMEALRFFIEIVKKIKRRVLLWLKL